MKKHLPAPPWLHLLNALHKDWRESEIELGRDPDPVIERLLHEAGKWPQAPRTAAHP